jgi:hypothetical protein
LVLIKEKAMTSVIHKIDNMSEDAAELKEQLAGASFVITVTLSDDEQRPSVNVCALAKPGMQTVSVDLQAGSTVPSVDMDKLMMLTLPDKTTRYCTGGGGNWFWIGVAATHA